MKTVKVEMFLDIEDDFVDKLKRIEHHADYFIDLDSYPEIASVYGVKVTDVVNSDSVNY